MKEKGLACRKVQNWVVTTMLLHYDKAITTGNNHTTNIALIIR